MVRRIFRVWRIDSSVRYGVVCKSKCAGISGVQWVVNVGLVWSRAWLR